MKYGIIILVLCYLFVSGCIPDKNEKKQAKHKKTEIQATVEQATTPHMVIKEEKGEETQVVVEKTVESAPVETHVQQEQVTEQPQETTVAEETKTEEVSPANKPCDLQKRYPSAAGQPAPHLDARGQEIAAAVEKLVVATNNMVYMTRQMVTATEQMLKATRGVAVEVVETGKEIVKNETAQQTAAAETGVKEAMNNMVEATREVVKATKDALSTATGEQPQQQ